MIFFWIRGVSVRIVSLAREETQQQPWLPSPRCQNRSLLQSLHQLHKMPASLMQTAVVFFSAPLCRRESTQKHSSLLCQSSSTKRGYHAFHRPARALQSNCWKLPIYVSSSLCSSPSARDETVDIEDHADQGTEKSLLSMSVEHALQKREKARIKVLLRRGMTLAVFLCEKAKNALWESKAPEAERSAWWVDQDLVPSRSHQFVTVAWDPCPNVLLLMNSAKFMFQGYHFMSGAAFLYENQCDLSWWCPRMP